MLEVVEAAVAKEIGAERVGIRISPVTPANDVADSDPQALFDHLVARARQAAASPIIHVVEGATGGPRDCRPFDYGACASAFDGRLHRQQRLRPGARRQGASRATAADLIAFGRPFIANPDLVERLQRGAPLNTPDGHLLWRRRQGLHRLSDAGRAAGGAVGPTKAASGCVRHSGGRGAPCAVVTEPTNRGERHGT